MSFSPSESVVVTQNDSFAKEAALQLRKFVPASAKIQDCPFKKALETPKEPSPFLVIVDLSDPEGAFLPWVKRICAHFNPSLVACAGHPSDVSLILELVKMGVTDFLKMPLEEEEVRSLVERRRAFAASSASPPPGAKLGSVVTLFSPKGGTGVTLLTANLAVALSENRASRVVIWDMAPQCGDAAAYLNLTPRYTMKEIIANGSSLDASFLEGVLAEHSTGVKVLGAPVHEEETAGAEDLPVIKAVLAMLRETYDCVLIDGGHLNPALLRYLMLQSNLVFLVGSPDVVALKGLVHCFEKLGASGLEADRIKVVVNRFNSKSQIDTREFEKTTRHSIAARLPNNYSLCIEAVNTGRPISEIQKQSDLSRKIAELAQIVENAPASGSALKVPPRPGIFGWKRNPR